MLADDYRVALRRWMTNCTVLVGLVWAVGAWYAIYERRIEVLWIGTMFGVVLLFWTFVAVTAYYLVVGYLSTKPGRAPPGGPPT